MIKWDQLNTITERFFAFYFFNEKNGTRGGRCHFINDKLPPSSLRWWLFIFEMRHPSFGIAM